VFFLAKDETEKIEAQAQAQITHNERRIQKMILKHQLPLAIPAKKTKLNLAEVSLPVVVNSSPVIKNKIDFLPRTFVKIDTLFFNTSFFNNSVKKVLNPALVLEMQRTERDVKRTLAAVSKTQNLQAKTIADNERALSAMKAVLERIKATKQKLKSSTALSAASSGGGYRAAISSSKPTLEEDYYDDEDDNDEIDDIDVLAREIKEGLEEIQQQYLSLNNLKTSANFNVRPATMVYTIPPHSYSYVYTEKPKVKTVAPPPAPGVAQGCSCKTEKKVSVYSDIESNDKSKVEQRIIMAPSSPEQPAKKETPQRRRLGIIHI